MAGLRLTLSRQVDLKHGMADIDLELRRRHEEDTYNAISEEPHRILRSIGVIDPRYNHEISVKMRHAGTGLWLEESEEFNYWLKTAKAKTWLYGIPGSTF